MKVFASVLLIFFISSVSGSVAAQDWRQYADSAKLLKDQQMNDEALLCYIKARQTLPGDSDLSITYVQLSKNIGELYFTTAEYEEGIVFSKALLKTIGRGYGENNGDYAWTCNLLGALYNTVGEIDSALIIHQKAKEIRLGLFGNQNASYAQSCNNIGALYRDMGQFDKAEPLIVEAKKIRETIKPEKQAPVYAISCTNLANLYRDMGQYEKAEQLYIEANGIRANVKPVNESRDYAAGCNILADLYYYMHQYDKAESLYLKAKYIRAKIRKESYDYGQTCNNLASLYREKGEYQNAEAYALEARSAWDSAGISPEHPSRIINTNNLGELYYAMGRYKESEAMLLDARKSWQKDKDESHPYLIANSDELAKLYWLMDEPEKTSQLLTQLSTSKYKQLDRVFQFTNESEKQEYLTNISGSNDEYQSFYYTKYDHSRAGQAYDVSLLNRNLILSSVQQTRQLIHTSGDKALLNTYNEWIALKQRLANLYSSLRVADNEKDAARIKDLERRTDSIEKLLTRSSSAFRTMQTVPDWRLIQRSLAKDEAAIEFVEFNLFDGRRWTDSVFYAALVLTKNMKEPRLVPLFEESQLKSVLDKRASGIAAKINLRYSAESLYRLIWEPVDKYLDGIAKVYFAPSGLLHEVSFAALHFSPTQFISDKYQLVQLLTTATVKDNLQQGFSPKDKIVLYGDVQYNADATALKKETGSYKTRSETSASLTEELISRGGDFSFWTPLPGSKQEIEQIRNAANKGGIKSAVYTGLKANEESVKALGDDTTVAVLHIATHGFFYPDPKKNAKYSRSTIGTAFKSSENPLLRGGLVMAGGENTWKGKPIAGIDDGILTAYEVSNMYLPNTKVVVLSACETGIGDIHGSEGVYGLQRSFKIAGVKYLLMSLWEVPDAESGEFMQLFYKNLFNKKSVSDAFYAAQGLMREKYKYEPFKWAAWVLIR